MSESSTSGLPGSAILVLTTPVRDRPPEALVRDWPGRVFESNLSGALDVDAVVQSIAEDFGVPYPITGLDAMISVVADLEWAPSDSGYTWVVDGLSSIAEHDERLFEALVHSLIHIADRWHSRSVPFRIVVNVDSTTKELLLNEVWREFERFRESTFPWVNFHEPAILTLDEGTWHTHQVT